VAEREQIKRTAGTRHAEETVEEAASSDKGEKLKAELDDLLDEIDEVLETNAEDFVKSYVQKGGQ
jgi:prokaryotic ubiquitin-like protein Pup